MACAEERNSHQAKIIKASGFLGFGRDEKKLEKLKKQKLPTCEKLNRIF